MAAAAAAALSLLCFSSNFFAVAQGSGLFPVYRAPDPPHMTMHTKRTRDNARILASFDMKMGGLGGVFQGTGIYFALLNLGTPAKTYRVQIDTGSDLLFINGVGCKKCPMKTGLGFTLTRYDRKASSTSKAVGCDEELCSVINKGEDSDENCDGASCLFSTVYSDGSTASGQLVRDNFQYVTAVAAGSNATKNESVPVVFGLSSDVTGFLAEEEYGIDGILGFGRANESFVSQLAAQGKAKRIFGHCLDNRNGGGGIFTVGEVVYPELKRTKMLVEYPGYRVTLTGITVGGEPLEVPPEVYKDGQYSGAVFDSSASLAYFPQPIYDEIAKKVVKAAKPPLLGGSGEQCYPKDFKPDLDKTMPNITLNFAGEASVTLTPADYLTELAGIRCLSMYPSPPDKETKDMFILGSLIMGNKVILYDVENQEFGISADHNCSSFVKVKDDQTGDIFRLNAVGLPSAAEKAQTGMRVLVVALSAIVYAFMAI